MGFLKEIYYYFTSRVFWLNFLLAMGLLALIMYGLFGYLNSYTRHGQSITLPDLRGTLLDDAKQEMKDTKLELYILDSLYFPEKEPFAILEQDPPPLSRVKENRKVYVTVNASVPPPVAVPDVWEKDKSFAQRLLRARGLKVNKKIEYKPDPATNTVLQVKYKGEPLQRPEKDKPTKVPKGSELTLVVAEGSTTSMTVPKFTCRTVDEARYQLETYNLQLGTIVADETVTDESSAYIYRQSPDYSRGDIIRMGEAVDVWITKTKPGECANEW